jgi:hypothetical protein
MTFSKTTQGLIKAAVNLSPQARAGKNAKRRAEHPTFQYEPDGHATHGKKYLSEEKRKHINVLLARYKEADNPDERKEILGLLAKEPIQLVPVKREIRIDYSKYPIERLPSIYANGGGMKEQARAKRRAAAMAEGVGYGALDGRRLPIKDDAPVAAAA